MNNMKEEMEAAYPIPDTPHTSVKMRTADQREAFQVGWQAALASKASKGVGPDYSVLELPADELLSYMDNLSICCHETEAMREALDKVR